MPAVAFPLDLWTYGPLALLSYLRFRLPLIPKNHHPIKHINQHRAVFIDITHQDLFAKQVDDLLLNKAFERPCAELRIEAIFRKVVEQVVAKLELDS